MSQFRVNLEKVWRRWWLVLAVTVVGCSASLAWTLAQPPTYTAGWALTGASQERSPEQDAVLAQGYVELFNEPGYQDLIRDHLGVAEDIALDARIIGTSPIVYIEATAGSPEAAQSTAQVVATQLREDIRANLTSMQEPIVSDLHEEIAAETERLGTLPPGSAVRVLTEGQIRALQDRVVELETDLTNQLRNLQVRSSVSTNAPDPVLNGALGLVGGLILGVLAALVVGSTGWRLSTEDEVRERLGLDTLAVVDRRSSGRQLQRLANLVTLADLGRPATLAVTSPRDMRVKSQVALGLATFTRVRGESTVLLQADLHRPDRSSTEERLGLSDYLMDPAATSVAALLVSGQGGLALLPSGASRADPYELFEPQRFGELVREATQHANVVVIDAPPVDAPEAMVAFASADATIVVIEKGVTRTSDAIRARETLDRVKAPVLGVVLCRSLRDLDSVLSRLTETPLAAVPARSRQNGVPDRHAVNGKQSEPPVGVIPGIPAHDD
jgi:Mrp family chromosome partitioning ATPase